MNAVLYLNSSHYNNNRFRFHFHFHVKFCSNNTDLGIREFLYKAINQACLYRGIKPGIPSAPICPICPGFPIEKYACALPVHLCYQPNFPGGPFLPGIPKNYSHVLT